MNKDLEVFENRSDDWLAKERKYEATVSAWDLDEAKKLRIEHEEDCEAREIKERHASRHQAYNDQFVNLNDLSKSKTEKTTISKTASTIVWLVFLIPLLFFVVFIAIMSGMEVTDVIIAIPIIILIIVVNLFKTKGRNK